jgi:hypothetical protein
LRCRCPSADWLVAKPAGFRGGNHDGRTQECQVALPSANRIPEIGVTITSNRPGIAAQVTIAANLNSPDGSYQGPMTNVGHGEFAANSNKVRSGFIVLPSGWPILGVGAEVTWSDGRHQASR